MNNKDADFSLMSRYISLVNADIALHVVTIRAISPYDSVSHAVLTQIHLNLNPAALLLGFRLCHRVQQHLLYR